MNNKLDISKLLEKMGEAVMCALAYKVYPVEKIEEFIKIIDIMTDNPSYLLDCEIYFRTAEAHDVLLYISSVLYNLKTQSELKINPKELTWLCSVWKNFLKRSISYQKIFPMVDYFRGKFKEYYNNAGSFVNQINNVNLIKEELIDNATPENAPLTKLENAHHTLTEILSWMKPTYFFLLDYYYQGTMKENLDIDEAFKHENMGLGNFGQSNYTYFDLTFLACQTLGVLEAAYLILKKKKTSKRIVTIDGKQKFLTSSEIYNIYLNKFTEMKKEINKLKQ